MWLSQTIPEFLVVTGCGRREDGIFEIIPATESDVQVPHVDTEIAEPSCALDGEAGSVSEAVSECMRFHACEQ